MILYNATDNTAVIKHQGIYTNPYKVTPSTRIRISDLTYERCYITHFSTSITDTDIYIVIKRRNGTR